MIFFHLSLLFRSGLKALRFRIAEAAGVFVTGFVGAIWGLALARALAESFPASPTFYLGSTLGLALLTATVAAIVGWWKRPPLSPPRPSGGKQPASRSEAKWTEGGRSFSNLLPLFLVLIYLFWPDVAPRVGWTLLGGSLALTALLFVRRVGQDAILPCALACVTLVLYLHTLGPTVGQADTFEFQVVAPTLGVAHPTGYPLYILSGKLFSLLPYGSVAWRVNLSSAVFATAAVVLLYHLVRRLTQLTYQSTNSPIYQPIIPFVAALSFAFSRVFWSQAVVAEVYALHNLFVAAVLLLLVDWVLGTRKRLFGLLALLLGLSFANHLTTALLLPAVGLALALVRPREDWRGWSCAAGLFLLGLSFYLYIYFRWPALHDGVWMSRGEFWRYVTGQQFGGALRLDAWRTDPTRYQIVGRLLREPFGWPGLTLGAIGLVWLALKKWRVALVTLVVFVAYVWYALSYYVPDVSVFLLPAHLVLAVWLGCGMTAIEVLDFRGLGRPRKSFVAVVSLGALLPLWVLWTNWPLVDQSGEREAYTWGERVLDLPLAPDAAILADSVRIAPLYYLQRIEGRRPDLDLLVLADEATYRTELDARLAAGQTVYLARFLPGLEGLYHLRSLGPLTEVGTAPLQETPPLDRALGVWFGSPPVLSATLQDVDTIPPAVQGVGVELLGFTGPVPGPAGGMGLTFYWRAEAPIGEVYHVRLRLVDVRGPQSSDVHDAGAESNDDGGQVWWQAQGRHAANNYYPTTAWRPGEVVADYYEVPPLAVEPEDSAGGYILQVGLFRPFSDEGLMVEEEGMWYPLLALDPPAPANAPVPVYALRARFADPAAGENLILMGADLPDVVAAGATVELRLHWRASDIVQQTRPALTWADPQGQGVEVQVLESWGRSRLLLQAPASPGDYGLRLGWVDGAGRRLAARCGWLARPTDDCALATVRVAEAAASALANFDGKMLLLDAEVGATTLRPGASLPLTLRWQGLQPIQEDYTVSVQLVGLDGRLHGQTDTWPVQGTLPTSQWPPSQRITDPYRVTLSPDAPPGRYRVGVVVYLLATQTRLPLLDASGQTVGDVVWVGEVVASEK